MKLITRLILFIFLGLAVCTSLGYPQDDCECPLNIITAKRDERFTRSPLLPNIYTRPFFREQKLVCAYYDSGKLLFELFEEKEKDGIIKFYNVDGKLEAEYFVKEGEMIDKR